jgi:cell division protein FtsW
MTRSLRVKSIGPAQILRPRLLLIISTLILVIFGLVMVYSASFVESFTNPDIGDSAYIFKRQVCLVVIGLGVLACAVLIDYRLWGKFASWVPWGGAVILLILTWVMGNEGLGATRWLDLFGFNLQPSEFAKVAMLLLTGGLFVKLRTGGDRNLLFALIAAAIFFPTLLILLQPDLGTAIIALAGIVAVAYFAECSMKPLIIALLAIALVAVAAIMLAGFRMGRIGAWLDPWAYASDEGYQIVNSLYAFAGGGVGGVGLGMSHQKYLYLPQPHNDLIFPIIGEELGLIGAAFVILLFLLFLYAAYGVARAASDPYGRVIAGAAATMIGFQAFLNMLCMANILPMTGKPLPFFSAGGSSIIVTLMLVGLILNVSLRSKPMDMATERRDDLVILTGGQAHAADDGQPPVQNPVSRLHAMIQKMMSEVVRICSIRAQGSCTHVARAKAPRPKANRVKDARVKDTRAKDTRTKDARTKDARTKDARTKEARTKEARTRDTRSKETRAQGTCAQDSRTRETRAQGPRVKVSRAQSANTQDARAKIIRVPSVRTKDKDTRAQGSRTKETRVKDTRTQSSRTEETRTRETRAQGSRTKDTRVQDTRAKETRTRDTRTKDTRTRESRVQDTRTKETRAKATRAKETRAEAASTRDARAKDARAEAASTREARAQGSRTKVIRTPAAGQTPEKGRFRRQPTRTQAPSKPPLRKAPRSSARREKSAVSPAAATPQSPVQQGASRRSASESSMNLTFALSPARNQAGRPGNHDGSTAQAAPVPQRGSAALASRHHRSLPQKAAAHKGSRR